MEWDYPAEWRYGQLWLYWYTRRHGAYSQQLCREWDSLQWRRPAHGYADQPSADGHSNRATTNTHANTDTYGHGYESTADGYAHTDTNRYSYEPTTDGYTYTNANGYGDKSTADSDTNEPARGNVCGHLHGQSVEQWLYGKYHRYEQRDIANTRIHLKLDIHGRAADHQWLECDLRPKRGQCQCV